jgi:hypothetical protein
VNADPVGSKESRRRKARRPLTASVPTDVIESLRQKVLDMNMIYEFLITRFVMAYRERSLSRDVIEVGENNAAIVLMDALVEHGP